MLGLILQPETEPADQAEAPAEEAAPEVAEAGEDPPAEDAETVDRARD